jgi:hypothetical protein
VLAAHFSEEILNEQGRIDQLKTDWVSRMGDDWYCRASGDALFTVPKPNTHLGIGIDQIPEHIRQNPALSGNDLGRLGNIEQLPTPEEVAAFWATETNQPTVEYARQLLAAQRVKEAWMVLIKL